MAIDFSKPVTGDNYSTQFVPNLHGNFAGLAQMLDSSLTTIVGSIPTGAKRYNRTSTAFEEWNGSAWTNMPFQGIRFSSGNLALGVTPLAGVPWMVHTGTNRNVATLDHSSMATLVALNDAGSSVALRLMGNGLYFSGNGSAEHGQLNSSGNWGLGIAPACRLHISGDFQQENANYVRGKLAAGTSTRLLGLNASNDLYFGAIDVAHGNTLFVRNGATQMMLDSSGNLLAGNTVPAATEGAVFRYGAAVTMGLYRDLNVNSVGAAASGISFGALDGTTQTPGAQILGVLSNPATAGYLTVYTRTAGALTEKWRFTSSGQLLGNTVVDSGLTNALLQVAGNADFRPASGTAQLHVRGAAGFPAALELSANAITAGSGLSVLQDNAGVGYLYNRQNAALLFGTNNTTRMSLSATGALTPQTDVGQNFGGPSNRWASAFAGEFSIGANQTAVSSSGTTLVLGAGSAWTIAAIAPGGTGRLFTTADGRVYGNALHNNANPITGTTSQYIGSGNYTPVLTNNSNATSISLAGHRPWTFKRVGNVVSVSGWFTCGATAANTVTTVRATVPIPSNFSGGGEGAGVATILGQSPFAVGSVEMDATLDEAVIRFIPSVTTTGARSVEFQYEVLS